MRIIRAMAIVPSLALLIGLFWLGLITVIVRAAGVYPAFGVNEPTVRYVREAILDPSFWPSLWLTLRVATISTVVAAIAGSAIAIGAALWTRPSWRLRITMQMPLYIPHIVVANMILVLLSQSGLFARVLYALGWIVDMNESPTLVYDAWGLGISLGFSLKETPFVAVLVYPFALAALNTYGKLARTLGASTTMVIGRVIMPMIGPAVVTAAIIVFAYSFSSFEVPYVLGRTYPKVLSNAAYDLYTSADPQARPVAMALGSIIVAINGVLALAYFGAARRYDAVLAQIRGSAIA